MDQIHFTHASAKAFIADRLCDAIRAACVDRNMLVLSPPTPPMPDCAKFRIAASLSDGSVESIAATLHYTMFRHGAIKVYGPTVSFVSPDDPTSADDTRCLVTCYIPSVDEAKKEVMTNPMRLFEAVFMGPIDITTTTPEGSPIELHEHVTNEPALIAAAIMLLAQRFHRRSSNIVCPLLSVKLNPDGGDMAMVTLRGYPSHQ